MAVLASSTVASAEGWEAGPAAPVAFLAGGLPETPTLLESLVGESEAARLAAMEAYRRAPVFYAEAPESNCTSKLCLSTHTCHGVRAKC